MRLHQESARLFIDHVVTRCFGIGDHPRVVPLQPFAQGAAGIGAEPYDDLDRRLMDTFPASDAVARY